MLSISSFSVEPERANISSFVRVPRTVDQDGAIENELAYVEYSSDSEYFYSLSDDDEESMGGSFEEPMSDSDDDFLEIYTSESDKREVGSWWNYWHGMGDGVSFELSPDGSRLQVEDLSENLADDTHDRTEAYFRGLVMGGLLKQVCQPRAANEGSDQALEEARTLFRNIEEKLIKTDMQLRRMGGLPVYESESGRLADVELSNWDHLKRYSHLLKGSVDAVAETLRWGIAAVALPTVTGAVSGAIQSTPIGYGVTAIAFGFGAYMCLSALRDAPQLRSDLAAVSLIDSVLKEVQPQIARLQSLLEDEQRRQKASERIMLISMGRHEGLHALELELDQISEALEIAEQSSEYSVTLGDAWARETVLSLVESIRMAFNLIFEPIVQAWSSASRFFATLPIALEHANERRQAVSQERTEKIAYKWALAALSERSETSLLDPGDEVLACDVKECTQKEKINRLDALRWQLHTGENLMRLISDGQASPHGIVMVKTKESPPIRYLVPSSVTLARALTFYFSVIADKSGANLDVNAHRDPENGSLVVTDPDGSLYNFLLHVPSAYTASMMGLKNDGAHGRLTIDDHGAGFPGGACSMQFEQGLSEEGVPELRISFLSEQAQSVFTPLENESRVLRSLYIAMHERRAEQSAEALTASDYSDWTIERLRIHQAELIKKLVNEVSLQQIDNLRHQALHQWERPVSWR